MVLAVMAILSSCSPYNLVTSTTYNDADLSNYSTFRIVTPDEGKLPPGMAMVTYYNIAAAIREQMVDRGFREDSASPLLINIGLTIKQQIATEPAIPPGGYPYYWGPYHGYAPGLCIREAIIGRGIMLMLKL